MELFILRHGHAEAEAPRDSLRELSAHGKQEVRDSVQSKLDELANVELLIVSPYIRAQQSAAIVQEMLPGRAVLESSLLTPSSDPKDLIQFLYNMYQGQGLKSLMLVAHQPLLGILLDQLCGLEPGRYRLATASMAAMDVDVMAIDCCKLRWVNHVDIDLPQTF